MLSVEHTVNPFNRNKDGSIKTPDEVREAVKKELHEKMNEFKKQEHLCRKCSDSI